jgi:NifU-like protein
MWDYSEKVRKHFLDPQHVGEIESPDLDATVGNIVCGDALRLMVKLDDDGRIADARFQTFGCASAIASSDALIDLIRGKTVEEAARVTNDDIADYLDGLPEAKMHCSVMGMEALQKAIARYRHLPFEDEDEGEVVCRCFGVTDKLIEKVVRAEGLETIEQVTHWTKAGGGCGGCHKKIQAILDRVQTEAAGTETAPADAARSAATAAPSGMTNLERIRRIERVVADEIRPALQRDGGDIDLVDVVGRRVQVTLRGTCAHCGVRAVTLRDLVEQRLREAVDPDITVEEVAAPAATAD